MTGQRLPTAPDVRTDDGFTLVEVVFALTIFSVVAAAALSLFLQSMAKAAEVQRTQTAVAVANSAMEQVRAVTPTWQGHTAGPSGIGQVGGLVAGRSSSAVLHQWAGASFPGQSQTLPLWDSSAAPAAPVIALDPAVSTVSGQEYRTTVYIGACTRLRTQVGGDCTAAAPGPDRVTLDRVVVVVRWTPTGSSAPERTHALTALVDPNGDPTWRVS